MLTTYTEAAVRHELIEQLSRARQQTDDLFAIVNPDSLYERPIAERHRIVFYIGHLEAFDWNLLQPVFGLKSFHPEFDRLFAFGIDPVGGGLPTDQPADWPSLEMVRDYVRTIRVALDEKLSAASFEPREYTRDGFPLETLLNVAIEHRLMHVETLAYMFHQLPVDRKIPQSNALVPADSPVVHQMIAIPAGTATLGLSRDSGIFGWDNEFEAFSTSVPCFEIDRYMVTNRQFVEFTMAGGYENRTLWGDDDWKWREDKKILHPVFWRKAHEGWLYRTMFEEIPLPMDWPVYVSHAEAAAYARWVG